MNTYVSTFVSGFQKVVSSALNTSLHNVNILHLLDGLVVYETNETYETIIKLRFFNNSFLLIEQFTNITTDVMHQMMAKTLKSYRLEGVVKHFPWLKKGSTFRLIFSNQNELVGVNKKLKGELEKKIVNSSGLLINRVLPDHEFWFLYRGERLGFFMLRLTKHASTEKKLQKGELRHEISHLLCVMSNTEQNDIFLDPFSGYGSIPLERARSFPFNLIFARDKDGEKVRYIKQKIKQSKRNGNNIISQQVDLFEKSKAFEDEFIDKIVTDPPWGMYEQLGENMTEFYLAMLDELTRILKINGIMVVLTANKAEFEKCIEVRNKRLIVAEKHNVLVSGKKAAVYKLIKRL